MLTDDDEHAKRLLGVLDLGQEARRKAERQSQLRRLIEVGLENIPNGKIQMSDTNFASSRTSDRKPTCRI